LSIVGVSVGRVSEVGEVVISEAVVDSNNVVPVLSVVLSTGGSVPAGMVVDPKTGVPVVSVIVSSGVDVTSSTVLGSNTVLVTSVVVGSRGLVVVTLGPDDSGFVVAVFTSEESSGVVGASAVVVNCSVGVVSPVVVDTKGTDDASAGLEECVPGTPVGVVMSPVVSGGVEASEVKGGTLFWSGKDVWVSRSGCFVVSIGAWLGSSVGYEGLSAVVVGRDETSGFI
jgi:hypothetical protein